MIKQEVIWHSMKGEFRNSYKEVWVLFKNVSSNKFEVHKIERDYFSNDWYFSDCDEMVEFISDSLIPIMWTDSFNNTILKTIIKE